MEFFTELITQDIFLLFLIIALGKIVERIKIKNFSLGIAAIFFVAAIFGYYGYNLPKSFQLFGLSLFIYCVGIESGPQFFSSFNKKAVDWGLITLLHFSISFGFVFLIRYICTQIDSPGTFIGLYTASIKSSIGMASVIESMNDSRIVSTFGIIYPFSLIGTIYLIPMLPKIFRQDVELLKKDYLEKQEKKQKKRFLKIYRITNQNIIGKKFTKLDEFNLDDVIISRYIKNGKNYLVDKNTVLEKDDHLVAVGSKEGLSKLEVLIGDEDEITLPASDDIISKTIIVSKPNIAGHSLSQLGLESRYNVKFTRINRSGLELTPAPGKTLLLGDRVVAIGHSSDIEKLIRALGDDVEEVFKTQFAPISIGIVLGFLFGQIPLPVLKHSLGMTGGILLIAMYLGYKIKIGGILWQIPNHTNAFIKQFGLYVFFAVLGTNAGKDLIQVIINQEGLLLAALGMFLSYIPIILVYGISIKLLKRNPLDTIGLISGNITHTSAIVTVNERLNTDLPNTAFAFAYPLGLLMSIITSQILSYLAVLFF